MTSAENASLQEASRGWKHHANKRCRACIECKEVGIWCQRRRNLVSGQCVVNNQVLVTNLLLY